MGFSYLPSFSVVKGLRLTLFHVSVFLDIETDYTLHLQYKFEVYTTSNSFCLVKPYRMSQNRVSLPFFIQW